MDTPFTRSYWVVPGALLAGYYPGALDPVERDIKLNALLDFGIQVVINLMEPDETDWEGQLFAPYSPRITELAMQRGLDVQCRRFPIRDGGIPTPARMQQILEAIETALDAGQPIYVHCWGGKGRTGTVVGCFLAQRGIATGDAALAMVQQLRCRDARAHEPSPETTIQCGMVRSWPRGTGRE